MSFKEKRLQAKNEKIQAEREREKRDQEARKIDQVTASIESAAQDLAAGRRAETTEFIAAIDAIRNQTIGDANEQRARENGKKRREILTLLFVAAYTICTFWLLNDAHDIAQGQHNDTLGAIYNAQIAAIDQHTDTARALIRTDAANAVLADQEKRQFRAYIVISQILIKTDTSSIPHSNYVHASVEFKNVGLTPAYDFSGWTCIYVGKFHQETEQMQLEETFPKPKNTNPARATKTVLGPSSTKGSWKIPFCPEQNADRSLTPDEIARLKSGTAAIYFYGRETYTDAFGDKRWITWKVFNNDFLGLTIGGATLDTLEGFQAN